MSTKTKAPKKSTPKKSPKANGGTKANAIAQATTSAEDGIHSRAMLVTLNISVFTARRFDRDVTDKVNAQYAADTHAGRYNKHLFGGSQHAPSYAAVVSAAGAARQVHYEQSLPWNDDGWRLLPTANYFEYQEAMAKARQRFDDAVQKFIAEYPTLKEEAKVLLNGLYRELDYPEPGTLPSRFGLVVDFSPVPASGDFRLDLPTDQMATIEGRVADRVNKATETAMQDAWRRLYEIVEKLHANLDAPATDSIRHDAARAAVRHRIVKYGVEILDVLKRLNVTNDANLEELRATLEKTMKGIDFADLKSNDKARAKAARATDEIMKRMADFYTAPEAS